MAYTLRAFAFGALAAGTGAVAVLLIAAVRLAVNLGFHFGPVRRDSCLLPG